jgi:Rod binding domain-containing protein
MTDAITSSISTRSDAPRLTAETGDDFTAAPVFNGFMDRAYSEGKSEESQLREAAEKLVSTTLIMPMFEQLRSDPLAANLFHGGRGEKIFQQQMDQVLSDRIASATRFDLVESVYQQLSSSLQSEAVNVHG